MRATRHIALLLIPALTWIAALIQRAQPLNWDEIEFFRATRWVADGRVPYRDFWEHHTPFQWLVFAPLAKLLSSGPGVDAVLAMRWAQVPLWIAGCVLLFSLMKRSGIEPAPRWLALLLLLTSRSFVIWAIQYRVDALGNVLFLGGLMLLTSRRWIAFGVVMSAAALANMRLAPVIIATAVVASLWRSDEQRWGWNLRAARMVIGVIGVAGTTVALLLLSGAWPGFIEGVYGYNTFFNRVASSQAPSMLLPVLIAPFRHGDAGGIALWLLAIGGTFLALRDYRRPSLVQILALLFLATLVSLATASPIQYDYHLQTAWLLMVPLGSLALTRMVALHQDRVTVAVAMIVVAMTFNFSGFADPSFGKGLDYQDLVMREADQRTAPSAAVWDGSGYALRRRPAYRYWFLPVGVRLMAQRGMIAPYDPRKDPPAAIVYDQRVHRWLLAFPGARRYITRHYLPLYRNLLLPGMSARVDARPMRTVWRVPASAQYDLWASGLAGQPQLVRLLERGTDETEGPLHLDQLPAFPYESLELVVNGVQLERGTRSITLEKGSLVELKTNVSQPAGVLLVLRGIRTLAIPPEHPFAF